MNKLTTDRLETIATWREKYGNGANVMIPAEEAEFMARQLLAYEQAAEHPAARITWDGSEFSVSNVSEDFLYGGTAVYLAPVLPKQPELVDLSQQVEILNRILNWILKELPVPTQKASAMAIRLSSVINVISDLEVSAPAKPVSEPYKLISVKDDTPTESGDYWCYLGKDFESSTKYRVVHFDVRHHEFQDHRVTHWMRLPAEPEQEA